MVKIFSVMSMAQFRLYHTSAYISLRKLLWNNYSELSNSTNNAVEITKIELNNLCTAYCNYFPNITILFSNKDFLSTTFVALKQQTQ